MMFLRRLTLNLRPGPALPLLLPLLAAALGVWAQIPRSPSPPLAKVYFIAPAAGASLQGPIKVVMGLSGMGVAPAGVDLPETGHHHLLVDVEQPILDAPLPMNEQYRHFGKGQTEATLSLPPGRHTLQLLLADKNHIPHQPPVISERISVTVLP